MKKWKIDIAHGWLRCDVCGRVNEDMNIAKCLSDFRDEWWRTTNDRYKIWQNEKI